MDRGKYCSLGFGAGYQKINWEKRATNRIREERFLYLNVFSFLSVTLKSQTPIIIQFSVSQIL